MTTAIKLALETAARKNPEIAQAIGRPTQGAEATEAKATTPNELPKSVKPVRRYVAWTAEERMSVAIKWQSILEANPDRKVVSLMEALTAAQGVLPEDRRRPSHGNELVLLRKVLEDAKAKKADVQGQERMKEVFREEIKKEFPPAPPPAPPAPAPAPVAAPAPEVSQVKLNIQAPLEDSALPPVRSHLTPLPTPFPPPPAVLPQTPTLGPLELALQQMVGTAVGQQLGTLIEAMREEQVRTRMELQHLLTEQYDALRSYWDPEYKKAREAQARYIPEHVDTTTYRDTLNTVRIRPKRVLISGGADDRYHAVQRHFKGVDFEFIDAHNARAVSKGGYYDLVVCTKFTSHPARDTLINLHGNKVVMVDGSVGPVIAIIKQKLEL